MTRTDYVNDANAPAANSIVVATTVFVQDEAGRILLIRRSDNGLWALPGGGLELGETVNECAVRETREEAGIDIAVIGLVGIYSNPAHVIAYSDGEVRQQFSICLRGRPLGGSLQPSSESTEVRWVAQSALDNLPIHSTMLERLDRGFAHDAEPYLE